MISVQEADSWIGRTAMDETGEQIGRITQIWVDDASGQPEWASVKIAGREGLVPLAGAYTQRGGVQFGYSKEQIRSAPRVAQDGHLDVGDTSEVASHYGTPGPSPAPVDVPPAAGFSEHPDEEAGPEQAGPPSPQAWEQAAPEPQQAKSRFRRKAKSSDEPATRRFRRKASPSDQQAEDVPAQHDEMPVAG